MYNYRNDVDAFKQIRKTEGIRGLYRAYGATVISFGPFSALYFMFYEKMKGLFVNNDVDTYLNKVQKGSKESDIGFFPSMFCSMVAGGAASVITNPLDMAKLRLQVQRAGSASGNS